MKYAFPILAISLLISMDAAIAADPAYGQACKS